jgi:uncharacterized protein involved in exopolysaccharide biosynthesis
VQQSSSRVEELQTALKDQQDRIMKARESRVDMAVLSRDLDNAQRAYDGALSRAIAVKVDSKVRQTNLAMLTPAVEPLKPAVPKVGLISALSVLIGLLLAAGMVYVLELLDRRVRSASCPAGPRRADGCCLRRIPPCATRMPFRVPGKRNRHACKIH